MSKPKYGIFMGSFDPIHKGHELFVKRALEDVETVVVVPAYQNPFKEKSAPFSCREHMLKLAFNDLIKAGKVIVDDLEKDISIETNLEKVPSWLSLTEVNRKYGDFVILTTSETFNEIPTWINSSYLSNYNYFVYDYCDFGEPIVEEASKLIKNFTLINYNVEDFDICELHSSQIRKGSKTFRKKYLTPSVYQYIKDSGLYPTYRNWCYTITEGEHKGVTLFNGRYTAISVIIACNGHILANKRGAGCPDFQGCWNIVCGFIEGNETAEEAVAREVLEECGITIDPEALIPLKPETEPGKCNNGNITLRYMLNLESREGLVYEKPSGEKDEVDDIRWIPYEEITNYRWAFNHKWILLKFIHGKITIP